MGLFLGAQHDLQDKPGSEIAQCQKSESGACPKDSDAPTPAKNKPAGYKDYKADPRQQCQQRVVVKQKGIAEHLPR